jgi:hypothetical protein
MLDNKYSKIIEMTFKISHLRNVYPVESPCKKTMYDSLADATETIEYLKENKGVKNLSAYKCTMCGFWHLTSAKLNKTGLR